VDLRIVFQNSGDSLPGLPIGVLSVNPDGSNLVKVADGAFEPCCSPDGNWIAYSAWNRNGCYNVHIMRRDGTNVIRITDYSDVGANSPSWSFDSTKIAYTTCGHNVENQIWWIDLITGQQHYLADGGSTPVWTANGEIIFEAFPNGAATQMIVGAYGEDLEESGLFEIGDWSVRSSPSGSEFAFLRNRDIFLIDSSGENLRCIREDALATGLSWSPDGQQIAFYAARSQSERPCGKEIYVIDKDGKNEHKIVANPWMGDRVGELVNVSWFC